MIAVDGFGDKAEPERPKRPLGSSSGLLPRRARAARLSFERTETIYNWRLIFGRPFLFVFCRS